MSYKDTVVLEDRSRNSRFERKIKIQLYRMTDNVGLYRMTGNGGLS